MKTARSLRSIFGFVFAVMALAFFLLGSCTPAGDRDAGAKTLDPDFEVKVLEVIRKHPDAILDSVQAYQQQQQKQQAEARQKIMAQLKSEPRLILRGSPTTGAANQKIILAEFSDFQCPYCAKASESVKQFMSLHGDEVTLTYKHFPLSEIHAQALPAALAAWAADRQGKFWEYHDALFAQQSRLGEALYLEIAKNLNLNLDKFNKDRAGDAARAAVDKDFRLGRDLGITGTPSFIMNGVDFAGVVQLSDLEKVLTQVKAGK